MAEELSRNMRGADMTGIDDHLHMELERGGIWDNPRIRIQDETGFFFFFLILFPQLVTDKSEETIYK